MNGLMMLFRPTDTAAEGTKFSKVFRIVLLDYDMKNGWECNPTISINKVQTTHFIRLHRFLEFFVRVASGTSTHP